VLIDAHCHIMPDRLATAIRRFFDDHMGFGSDCPNTTITVAESATYLRALGLSDQALRAVMGENAGRLVSPQVPG
jgi:predicted TIM-barrel fold metal-dependent hydrolase